MKTRTFVNAVLVGMSVLVAAPAVADQAEVRPCNYLDHDAVFLPGLRITINGQTTYIKVGERGLTKNIAYSEALATQFVRQLFDDDTLFIDYHPACYDPADVPEPADPVREQEPNTDPEPVDERIEEVGTFPTDQF